MTKVTIHPGICGFTTKVAAQADEEKENVKIRVASGCRAISDMMKALGEDFDAFELCLVKPGKGPLYEFAASGFPVHASCPALAGIIKCAEAECGLALKKNSEIIFEE